MRVRSNAKLPGWHIGRRLAPLPGWHIEPWVGPFQPGRNDRPVERKLSVNGLSAQIQLLEQPANAFVYAEQAGCARR